MDPMEQFMAFNFSQFVDLIPNSQLNRASGSVVSFFYEFYKHDPYPTIITTSIMPDGKIRGLNLHYLPFPLFRTLLVSWADNPLFNYQIVKNAPILKQAFRSYKISGIRNAKKIRWKAIITAMSLIRQYSPQERQLIQQAVDEQVMSRKPEILNEIFGRISDQYIAQNIQNSIQTLQPTEPTSTEPTTSPTQAIPTTIGPETQIPEII